MFSREQKALIRDWFAETAETLARAIEQEINRIGGRDMLLQRMDIFGWVYAAEKEVKMYREVLRFLDGAADFDMSLVRTALERRKSYYQRTLNEIESLRNASSRWAWRSWRPFISSLTR